LGFLEAGPAADVERAGIGFERVADLDGTAILCVLQVLPGGIGAGGVDLAPLLVVFELELEGPRHRGRAPEMLLLRVLQVMDTIPGHNLLFCLKTFGRGYGFF